MPEYKKEKIVAGVTTCSYYFLHRSQLQSVGIHTGISPDVHVFP